MEASEIWSDDEVAWKEENMNVSRKTKPETRGYERLQGGGTVTGKLLGGCLDGFPIYVGTSVWPTLDEWQDKILFLETSEDHPSPDLIRFYLMNLGAQGIFDVIQGILVGKPQFEKYYEEYKEVYRNVLRDFGQTDLPVLYNVNFGHAVPIGILPMGTDVEVDFERRRITLVECPVEK